MRYQLRYAAGIYWLLDTCQDGVPYKKPLPMNEMGAAIWKMMIRGHSREQIATALCQEYRTDRDVVLRDVEQFQAQLAEYGIDMTDHAAGGGRKDEK